MHRLAALFLCLFLVLSLATGSIAHATEGVTCVEATAANALDHSAGDADQVPADTDKAYPHHHGGCHGHQIGVPIGMSPLPPVRASRSLHLSWSNGWRAPVPADPALRPPRA